MDLKLYAKTSLSDAATQTGERTENILHPQRCFSWKMLKFETDILDQFRRNHHHLHIVTDFNASEAAVFTGVQSLCKGLL